LQAPLVLPQNPRGRATEDDVIAPSFASQVKCKPLNITIAVLLLIVTVIVVFFQTATKVPPCGVLSSPAVFAAVQVLHDVTVCIDVIGVIAS
jgi:hypothetical protein